MKDNWFYIKFTEYILAMCVIEVVMLNSCECSECLMTSHHAELMLLFVSPPKCMIIWDWFTNAGLKNENKHNTKKNQDTNIKI